MKKLLALLLTLAILAAFFSGCSDQSLPTPKNPVTLTMWHVYGSQTKSPLNDAIDEFNRTVGREHGITINVVSVTSSSAIDTALAASANQEPGAERMPDLFTAYPRAAQIVGQDILLRWDEYLTAEEIACFRDDFLTDCYFDGSLLMLPVAKSTEAFFLNQTLFDRFAAATGTTLEELQSFDGLFQVARRYYDWSNGQSFMQINDVYNYAYVGMKAYGSEFVRNGRLRVDDEAFEKIWAPMAAAAIYGGICLEDGYAAARWKTAEVIANTGSTADVLYQPTAVVYADNTSEPITAIALPYPAFTDSFSGVINRGGGLFAVKSEDARKNQAACIFAKWLTQKENNLNFVTQAGYLPVTDDAFDSLFTDMDLVQNKNYHSVYRAVDSMMHSHTFYTLPLFDNASDIQLDFEATVKVVLKSAHNQYIKRIGDGELSADVLNELVDSSLAELRQLTAK